MVSGFGTHSREQVLVGVNRERRPSSECLAGGADRQLMQASVPVAPPQPGDLAASHPGGGGEMQRRVQAMPAGGMM